MKNWRPITLLCVDYKIASKAIVNRLLTVLSSLINPNQTCGIKGRNPNVNNRMLQDIVSDLNSRGLGFHLTRRRRSIERIGRIFFAY